MRVIVPLPAGYTSEGATSARSDTGQISWATRPYVGDETHRWIANQLERDLVAEQTVLPLSEDRGHTVDGWPFNRRVASIRNNRRVVEIRVVADYLVHEHAIVLTARGWNPARVAALKEMCSRVRFELFHDVAVSVRSFWSSSDSD